MVRSRHPHLLLTSLLLTARAQYLYKVTEQYAELSTKPAQEKNKAPWAWVFYLQNGLCARHVVFIFVLARLARPPQAATQPALCVGTKI